MISADLVFFMVPALSLIYAGMGNRTFALTLFRLPLITCAFISLQVGSFASPSHRPSPGNTPLTLCSGFYGVMD